MFRAKIGVLLSKTCALTQTEVVRKLCGYVYLDHETIYFFFKACAISCLNLTAIPESKKGSTVQTIPPLDMR